MPLLSSITCPVQVQAGKSSNATGQKTEEERREHLTDDGSFESCHKIMRTLPKRSSATSETARDTIGKIDKTGRGATTDTATAKAKKARLTRVMTQKHRRTH